MRFRVAAIQDAGLPQGWTDARLWLEDWINKALHDAEFGCPEVCIMILVFATSGVHAVRAASRLSKDEIGNPILALHISVDAELVAAIRPEVHLTTLCAHIAQGLPKKPLRKPKGLDYERLRQALLACIAPLSQSAA